MRRVTGRRSARRLFTPDEWDSWAKTLGKMAVEALIPDHIRRAQSSATQDDHYRARHDDV